MILRGKGKISVSYEAIKRALLLPESARVLGILQGPAEAEAETFDVLVEDDSFPMCQPGEAVMRRYALGSLRDDYYDRVVYFPKTASLAEYRRQDRQKAKGP